jgi:hypothetical protein
MSKRRKRESGRRQHLHQKFDALCRTLFRHYDFVARLLAMSMSVSAARAWRTASIAAAKAGRCWAKFGKRVRLKLHGSQPEKRLVIA